MKKKSRLPAVWLAAATVAAAWVVAFAVFGWLSLFVHQPIHKDFRIFYVAAEAGLAHGWGASYDVSALRALSAGFPAGQSSIDSETAFANPPLFAWVVAPLTLFPLPVAYAVWSVLSLAALVAAWRLSAPFSGVANVALLLGGLAMWPVWDSLYYGQPTLVIVFLVALGWWLAARDRHVAAGIAIAVATAIKPQVVLLLPLALLVSGRGRAFVAWAVTSAGFAAIFAIALSPPGLQRWWNALTYLQANPRHAYFTLAYILGSGPLTYAVEAVLGLAALAVARMRRAELESVFAAGIVGSLAASFHLHQSDYAELVLVAWLVLRRPTVAWERAWLVAGIAGMQMVTLALPFAQLVLDAAWLATKAISSFGGSDASALATRRAGASAGRAGM